MMVVFIWNRKKCVLSTFQHWAVTDKRLDVFYFACLQVVSKGPQKGQKESEVQQNINIKQGTIFSGEWYFICGRGVDIKSAIFNPMHSFLHIV